jgi:hypothetical protein
MIISLDSLIEKYNFQFNGILHLVGHECQELEIYEKYIDRSKIL